VSEAQARLAIGTAQFGSAYGITNRTGQVSETEAAAILDVAAANGIDTIDTARLYGESEEVIGRVPASANFRIVTKTPKLTRARADEEAVDQLRAGFAASLKALQRRRVYGLLVHDAGDLLGAVGPDLWCAMQELKAAGLVEKIGVSVYDGEQIDRICDRFPVEIVQVPFNALDRRLADAGQLQRLSSAGIEIHARSLFLQGLLLAPRQEIPERFAPVRAAVERLDAAFSLLGMSRLEGMLAIALAHAEIARFVVGVTSVDELTGIVAAAKRGDFAEPLDIDLPPIDEIYLDPSRWHELGSVQ
jgi:aryl-alcohol dehydrogenase-like predicted oxidoreductase